MKKWVSVDDKPPPGFERPKRGFPFAQKVRQTFARKIVALTDVQFQRVSTYDRKRSAKNWPVFGAKQTSFSTLLHTNLKFSNIKIIETRAGMCVEMI